MKRIRISIAGLMVVVAVLAIDFSLIPGIRHVPILATRIGFLGALPMAHVLALYLAIVISNIERRGEVALSRVMFLLFGGTALLLLVAIAELAPLLFMTYISTTAGLFWTLGGKAIVAGSFLGLSGNGLLDILLNCVAVTLPLLVPALIAGWMTRGARLRVVKGPEATGDAGRALTAEPRNSEGR